MSYILNKSKSVLIINYVILSYIVNISIVNNKNTIMNMRLTSDSKSNDKLDYMIFLNIMEIFLKYMFWKN